MGSTKELQMIGCLGRHGSYSFFKSIKIGSRTLSLSSFFPVRIWPDSAILSIAEAQLLWSDRNESFCSLRLYFLPENTPEGRQQQHGEDEVIALQDKVIIRASDLISWLVDDVDWDWGYLTPDSASPQGTNNALCKAFISEKFRKNDKTLDFADSGLNGVVVLNYERYIRLRTILKRLEGSPELSNWLSHPLIMALGGLNVGPKCRLLFAKEVFDYPELEDHELLCNHLAPKLKGRPKKRKRRRNNSMGSESNESETSSAGSSVSDKCKKPLNGLSAQSKLHLEMKSSTAGLKNAAGNAAGVVMGANSNGLQILKIEPSVSKTGQSVNLRTRNQMNTSTSKAERKGLNNILKICNDTKGDGRNINAELLGPALSELAQKLEKSNALQILPIRPSVIQKQEVNLDLEGPRTKRMKTEHLGPGTVNDRGNYAKHYTPSSSRIGIMGPPAKNSSKIPFMGQMRGRQPDIPPHLDAKSTGAARVNRPFNKAERGILSITPVDPDLKNHGGPVLPMCIRSPSPFMSTSKIYGDPSVSTKVLCKPSLPSPVPDTGEILDFSVKKSRVGGDSSRPALNVNVNVNVNLESELLDLSVKSQSHSSKHIFHNLADIPPPNAMNQLGLRLTSEVTLFPSTNAPYKSKDSFLTPAHSHNNLSASTSKSNSNPKDWRGSPSSASPYVPISGKESLANAHSHHKPQASAMDRLPLPGHSHGTAAKPVATMINDKEKEGRDKARHADKVNQALSQFIHPSYYPKIDQNYLSLFGGPVFMPPPGLLSIPGAMEQFQIYKDLLQKGIVPQFPSWPHPTGKERGPKS